MYKKTGKIYHHICEVCKAPFDSERAWAKYCKDKRKNCKEKARSLSQKEYRQQRNPYADRKAQRGKHLCKCKCPYCKKIHHQFFVSKPVIEFFPIACKKIECKNKRFSHDTEAERYQVSSRI